MVGKTIRVRQNVMATNKTESYDPLVHVGLTRTDMHCHMCSKDFIAIIDFNLAGDHQIECPHCGHIHYRAIKDGKVTESRYSYDDRPRQISDAEDRNLWKAKTQPIATVSQASALIRDLWLRRDDV
jgi:DNA-directed RNA polymerase subunit RPC12/RpoP